MPAEPLILQTPCKGIQLSLNADKSGNSIWANLYPVKQPFTILFFAHAKKEDVYLSADAEKRTLWIGNAALDIRKKDADQVAATLRIKMHDVVTA